MLQFTRDLRKMLIKTFCSNQRLENLMIDISMHSEIKAMPSFTAKESFDSAIVNKNNFHQTIFQMKCKNATMTYNSKETFDIEKERMVPGFVHISKIKDLYRVSLYQNEPFEKSPSLTCNDQITKSMELIKITPLILCWKIEKLNENEIESRNSCRFLEFKCKKDASDFKSEFERAVNRSMITPQSIIKKRLFNSAKRDFEKSNETENTSIFRILGRNTNDFFQRTRLNFN